MDLLQREHPEILAGIGATRVIMLLIYIVSHSHLLLGSECKLISQIYRTVIRYEQKHAASRGFLAIARFLAHYGSYVCSCVILDYRNLIY